MNTALKVLGIIFLLLVGGCGGLMVLGAIVGGKAAQEVQKQIEAQPASSISLSQFNQLQNGMTYEQVTAILGSPGEVMSENSLGAGQFQTHTVMYQWQAGFMANMNCMFQNGKMISKAQFGLQ